MSTLPRCIVHIDADCFYAAVERERLQIPSDQPLAVQQWSGLIAVDYTARTFGITRGMSAEEAQRLCPNLKLVHVELLGSPGNQKVSLQRYRTASFKMMRIFERFLGPDDVLCRASIDEAYLDLSATAYKLGSRRSAWDSFRKFSAVIGELDRHDAWDLPLIGASGVVARIRRAVRDELGYSVSAGIANNRMVAKIASAQNKPDKQTIIARSEWAKMVAPLRVRKIPGLGGKLGRKVEGFLRRRRVGGEEEEVLVGELQRVGEEGLVEAFGEECGRWLEMVSRGEDVEEVKARREPKSILAMKSFRASGDVGFLESWLETMAEEIADRCEEDREMFKRQPKTFVLHYRRSWEEGRGSPAATVRTQMSGKISPKLLVDLGKKLMRGLQGLLPFTRLGMSVTDFVDIPKATVDSLFAAVVPGEKKDAVGGEQKKALQWEDVDVGVLRDLPQSIREEVERELKGRVKRVKKSSQKGGQRSISSFFK